MLGISGPCAAFTGEGSQAWTDSVIGSLCSWWVIGLRGCRRETGRRKRRRREGEAAGCQETRKAGRHERNSGRKTGRRVFFSLPLLISDEDVEGGEAGERGLQRVSD